MNRRTVKGLAIAGTAMWLLHKEAKRPTPVVAAAAASPAPEAVELPALPALPAPTPLTSPLRTWRKRAATTLAFTALFFAGAALAAGAGNEVAQVGSDSPDAAAVADPTTGVTTTDETTTDTTEVTTTDATTPTDVVTPDGMTADVAPAPDPAPATDAPADAATTPPAETVMPDPAPVADPLAATPDVGPSVPAPAADPAPAAAPPVVEDAAAASTVHHAAKPAQHRAPAVAGPVAQPASPFPVIAFNPQAWLVDHPGTPAGNAAVAIAERYLGVPYVWGGNKPSTGFDCSGLTQFVYAQLGVWLPHYAAAQFLAYPRLDPSQLQAGDLVFFEPKADGPGHVAIYAGNDTIVEAPHTGALVRMGSLSGAAASLGFLGAVRPSGGTTAVVPVRRLAAAQHTVISAGGARTLAY